MAGQIRPNYAKSFLAVVVATAAFTIAAACKSETASDPPVAVAIVTVSPAVVDLLIGQARQLTATSEDAAGVTLTGRTTTWSASNAAATVSGSGLVTAVSPGSCTITATSGGQRGVATVTVAPPPVATVTVTLAATTLVPGGTTTATAVLKDADGNTLPGRSVVWASSAPAVATVGGSGLVVAVAPGSSTIRATSEGKSGVATVTVAPPPVATVTVTLAATTLVPGGTTTATAVLKDADGNTLPGRSVVWASSAPAVATVGGSGLVVAVAPGSSTITATSEGQSGVATVTVAPLPATALSFPGNPNNPGVSPSVRFYWANPLPPRPATFIMRVFPRFQLAYYWGLGWVNGASTWDEAATSYYGFHPYGAAGKVTAPNWEITADNQDFFSGPISFGSWPPTQQTGAGWFVHVARVSTGRLYRFRVNWPNANPYIEHQDSPRPDPASPILQIGDVVWHPGFENYFGLIRGMQFYDAELSDAEVNAEIASPGSVRTPWYLNLNPTPSDISDKSGNGHHPVWGTTERPVLWTGP